MPKVRLLIDRDRLMNAPRKIVATATVNIFDRIQGMAKEIQVLALAAAFAITCETSRVEPQDAFTAVKNLMADPMTSTGRGLQFDAMKYHLETDILPEVAE